MGCLELCGELVHKGAFLPLSYRAEKTREGHAGEGRGRGPGERR